MYRALLLTVAVRFFPFFRLALLWLCFWAGALWAADGMLVLSVPQTEISFPDQMPQSGVLEITGTLANAGGIPFLNAVTVGARVEQRFVPIAILPRTRILHRLAVELVRYRTARYLLEAQLSYQTGGALPVESGENLAILREMPLKGVRVGDQKKTEGKLARIHLKVAETGLVNEAVIELQNGERVQSLEEYFDNGLPFRLRSAALTDLIGSTPGAANLFYTRFPLLTPEKRLELQQETLRMVENFRDDPDFGLRSEPYPMPRSEWRRRCGAWVAAAGTAVASWYAVERLLQFLF